MTPTALRSLAAEIAAAPGDVSHGEAWELSERALLACGWERGPHGDNEDTIIWVSPDGNETWLRPGPLPSAPLLSRDDAHGLLPEGWWLDLIDYWPDGVWEVAVCNGDSNEVTLTTAKAATEAAARTAAALYARAADMEG